MPSKSSERKVNKTALSSSWTTVLDLKAELNRLWERGDLLASLFRQECFFPRRLRLKGPNSQELSENFAEVRQWIAELSSINKCRLEMRQVNHRILGRNEVPAELFIDTLEDAIALLGKKDEFRRFSKIVEQTRQEQPRLLAWLEKKPLRALEFYSSWERLLKVVSWLEKHPRPNIYIRQVDLPGVDSKFIEGQRGILTEH